MYFYTVYIHVYRYIDIDIAIMYVHISMYREAIFVFPFTSFVYLFSLRTNSSKSQFSATLSNRNPGLMYADQLTQPAFTCSKSTIETIVKGVMLKANNKDTRPTLLMSF